ncbi:hypothetical protein [Curtobacterium sp. MCBD17_040]|uniref:hypothetical protein n=1 Tax=Curtobacterium sp. MCBD17_040 TaxID=2175674 RepID=UPI0024E02CF7|nr:hypothetical protein [Curtobacterium sp. MCBD17_040]WIB65907.1 hypothetical protein DEI94_17480 [Curtobacterium sp. MCBD17_040]
MLFSRAFGLANRSEHVTQRCGFGSLFWSFEAYSMQGPVLGNSTCRSLFLCAERYGRVRRIGECMRRLFRTDRGATDPILVIAAIAVSLVLLVSGSFALGRSKSNVADTTARYALQALIASQAAARTNTGYYQDDLANLTTAGVAVSGANAPLVVSDGLCWGAFVKSTTGNVFYASSTAPAVTQMPPSWPATPPAQYPSDCFWPSSAAALTQSTVTNLVPDPAARIAPDGTTVNYGLGGHAAVTAVSVPLGALTGFQVTPNGTSSDSYLGFGDSSAGVFRLGLQAGHTYTASGILWLPQPQTGTPLASRVRGISAFASSGSFEANSPAAANTAGPHRVSLTFTIPTAATNAFLRFYDGSNGTSDPVVWSDLSVIAGSQDRPFHDGTYSGWSWTEAANNSPSTGPSFGG